MDVGEAEGVLGAVVGATVMTLVCAKCARTFTNQSELDDHDRNGC